MSAVAPPELEAPRTCPGCQKTLPIAAFPPWGRGTSAICIDCCYASGRMKAGGRSRGPQNLPKKLRENFTDQPEMTPRVVAIAHFPDPDAAGEPIIDEQIARRVRERVRGLIDETARETAIAVLHELAPEICRQICAEIARQTVEQLAPTIATRAIRELLVRVVDSSFDERSPL